MSDERKPVIAIAHEDRATFEHDVNLAVSEGYRIGATSVNIAQPRWAAILHLMGRKGPSSERLADIQIRLQQMLSTLKDWRNGHILDEDCCIALESRIKSAFKILCKAEPESEASILSKIDGEK